MCLKPGVGVQHQQLAIRVVFYSFINRLQVGEVLGAGSVRIVTALPRFIIEPLLEDRTWLIGWGDVFALRPIRMLGFQRFGLRGGGLGLRQFLAQRQPIVTVAVHSRQPVMVSEQMVMPIKPIPLLRSELHPQVVKLVGVLRQRLRQRILNVAAVIMRWVLVVGFRWGFRCVERLDSSGVVPIRSQVGLRPLQVVRVAIADRLYSDEGVPGVIDR